MGPSKVDLLDPEAVRAAVVDPDRLAELRDAGLLDSGPEESFDRITRLAERLLGVPVALLTVVDRDRQYFKSAVGFDPELEERRQTALSHSFCQYAVAGRERFVVDDAREHAVVRDNPAIAEHDVIAYAGQPLETSSGHVLGTLCVFESEPRSWTDDELHVLGELAALAMTEIEYRLRSTALRDVDRLIGELEPPVAQLADAVRRLTDRAERADDPVVARLATASRVRLAAVERATTSIIETRRWRAHDDDVHRPSLVGERLMQAAKIATASVPDRALRTEIRDRPLVVRCDPYLLERALTNLLVGAMQHAEHDGTVEVVVHRSGGEVVLDLASEGRPMPIAELTRLVGQLDAAVDDDRAASSGASLQTTGRTTKIIHGSVSATTGLAGTCLSLRAALVDG